MNTTSRRPTATRISVMQRQQTDDQGSGGKHAG
jgi:hypothetical protein